MSDQGKVSKREAFRRYLPAKLDAVQPAKVYAPSNIALSKYWGKRDPHLNLPLNSSISISLREWGTTTRISPCENDVDEVWFDGALLSIDDTFAQKVLTFLKLFRGDEVCGPKVKVETENTIPTAAGLASSASGFAALTMAINKAFNLELPLSVLSELARMGSGSASRSLWHGFVCWDRGEKADGSDSSARLVDIKWPEFRIAIVAIDTGPKEKSSRDGMNHTVATSPLFPPWPEQAEKDCAAIEGFIKAQSFTELGETAEANALAMHASMLAARPSLSYLKMESWSALEKIWQARREGCEVYATMDAGANVKLLFLEKDTDAVAELFPMANIIEPFKPL